MTKTFQDIIDKTSRLEGAKNDLQKQVDATNTRIKGEDDQINQIQQAGAKVVPLHLKKLSPILCVKLSRKIIWSP